MKKRNVKFDVFVRNDETFISTSYECLRVIDSYSFPQCSFRDLGNTLDYKDFITSQKSSDYASRI